ncbi:CD209 antigen-like [Podarcis raffonei]|uniref:CD209 antigen-like n=1 Tax=Podarcis raffonei TaxID=65483 RepID=UPI0023299CC2|nr:CD209 antigen-like [Podarcis raffonei]XP_053258122.1 CD209 antigen-like [Podarcis raffonei]
MEKPAPAKPAKPTKPKKPTKRTAPAEAPAKAPAEAPAEAEQLATITDDKTERVETPTPEKGAESIDNEAPRKDSATATAAAAAAADETGASGFQSMVAFITSPTGERFVVLEIFILTAMTLLIFLLYQKEMKKRVEIEMAMNMIRNIVVGIDSNYKDKDDFQILAAAQNLSEEVRYLAKRNDRLQKEIDILTRNLKDGWVIFSNAFYLFSVELRSWMDSKKKCEREGAKLISIETVEEQFFINHEVKGHRKFFWIGLFKDKNVEWKWLSGKLPEDEYWIYYSLHDELNHDCTAMTFDCIDTCWIALECHLQMPYICKKVPDDAWL